MTELFEVNRAVCMNLLENLSGTFFRCKPDFKRSMLSISSACEKITGYTSAEFMDEHGVAYSLLLHAEDRERVHERWSRMQEDKTSSVIEYRIICKEGRVRWVKEISNCICNKTGHIDYVEGYIEEITAEKSSRLLTNAFTSYQRAINRGSIVSITDREGIILYANDLFCLHSQYTREELTGKSHRIINSGYHSAAFFEDLWTTIFSGEIWRGEIRNRAKDGSIYWVDTVISPIYNEAGEIEQFLSVRNVITEKKEAVEALQKSESRLKEAQQIAGIGSWELDIGHNKIIWSDEVYRIFDMQPGTFEGTYEAFLKLLHPDDVATVNNAYTDSIVSRTSYDVVHRILLAQGKVKYLHERANTVFDDKGLPVRTYGTVQDITKVKETELQLIKSNREYKQLVDHINEGIMIDDVSGKVVFANKQCLDLLGIEEADLGNHMLEDFVAPEYRIILRKRHNQRVEGEDVPGNFEYVGLKKDGTRIWLEVNVSLLKDEDGIILGTQSIIRDITDRKKIISDLVAKEMELENTVAELTSKNNELQKVNKEIDRFVYSASHDLRAPLTSVLGLIDVCKDVAGGQQELTTLFDMMKASVNRCDDAIKSIVNYSRNKKLDFNIEPVDLKNLAEVYIHDIRFMPEARGIHFDVVCEGETRLFTDKLRVNTILSNLISNAVKYQRTDEDHKLIRITIDITNERARLVVQDNGEGIPAQMHATIFDMFVRNSVKSTGSGLGLYICAEMVYMLGGTINLESEHGKGSTFIVELPNWLEKGESK